jgi:hypothetical protein
MPLDCSSRSKFQPRIVMSLVLNKINLLIHLIYKMTRINLIYSSTFFYPTVTLTESVETDILDRKLRNFLRPHLNC